MSRRPTWEERENEEQRRRAEFMREQEEHKRAHAEWRRHLGTTLHFPTFCADRRCKRARRCAGDVKACFDRFWPYVPERIKNELRHAMKLIKDGMAQREAAIEAHRYVAQRERINAELARRAQAAAGRGGSGGRAAPVRAAAHACRRPAHPEPVGNGRLKPAAPG